MGFCRGNIIFRNGGLDSDVGHRRIKFTVDICRGNINAEFRDYVIRRKRLVDGRKTEFPSKPVAADNLRFDAEGISRKEFHFRHIPGFRGGADSCGAYGFALIVNFFDKTVFHAVFFAEFRHFLCSAVSLVSEAVIRSADNFFAAELSAKDIAHKFLAGKSFNVAEIRRINMADSAGFHDAEFDFRRFKALCAGFSCGKAFFRKGENPWFKPFGNNRPAQNFPVTFMNSIENPKGNNGAVFR